ncbi:hypothetical protein CCAX7_41520 [Capsulimonas corticalis]|uniref:Uncharacterized protein n=1 Tax=Capsulimonas corticalis TaxID=2219043 RepID=A0A402CXY9_9BACT|nr:cupin domain-containing protein [Capsulimonas corticalis]BDI32101.1 hypothetical protein CCAX7_41520 [Capsulimonas corticalis]
MNELLNATEQEASHLTSNVVRAGGGRFFELGDHRGYCKVVAEQTGGAFLLAEAHADFGGGVPPHIHHREDETFYVLSGHFEFLVGDQNVQVGPGDTVYGPRDVTHAWRCTSLDGGRMLIGFTPGDNFQPFAIAMAQMGADPQSDMSNPERAAAFMALALRHGIEMLPQG